MERHSAGDSGNLASVGNSGHGGLGGTSPKIDMAGNNEGEGSTNRNTPAVTDANGQPAHSDRATESVSNRSLLANAFEGLVQNDIERKRLQEYKGKIDLINAEEQKLRKLNEQIRELSFAKGPRDTRAIRDLQDEATKTANRINIYDTQLLRLEASKPLQNVLEREKKKAYQRAEKKGKETLECRRSCSRERGRNGSGGCRGCGTGRCDGCSKR